jgi:hypothetical protein
MRRKTTTDADYCTHLAVNFGFKVKTGQDKYHGREAGKARGGVDLSKGQNQTRKPTIRPQYRHVPISSIDNVDVLG